MNLCVDFRLAFLQKEAPQILCVLASLCPKLNIFEEGVGEICPPIPHPREALLLFPMLS